MYVPSSKYVLTRVSLAMLMYKFKFSFKKHFRTAIEFNLAWRPISKVGFQKKIGFMILIEFVNCFENVDFTFISHTFYTKRMSGNQSSSCHQVTMKQSSVIIEQSPGNCGIVI